MESAMSSDRVRGGPVAQSLLIVEDDDILRARLAKAFRERGFEVQEASGLEEASAYARSDTPEYAVVDLRLQDGSGLQMVQALVVLDPATVIVVLTGYGSIATALDAIRMGATHYLTKPADVEEILAAFARADAKPGAPLEIEAPDATPTLARVEWEHINRVLTDCGGNVSKAARLLGLHRRSLQRKLQKFPPRR
jgi:two-component system response regulator RegA